MRAGIGSSGQRDTREATTIAIEAARKAIAGNGEQPTFALLFFGSRFSAAEVAETATSLLGDLPTIGCSTDGEITSAGLGADTVSVLIASSRQCRARVAVVEELGRDSLAAGRALADRLRGDQSRFAIALPDGLTGNGSAIIRGALEVFGPDFVIAGGTAGDRGQFEQTFQIAGGRAFSDALVGLVVDSPEPLRIGTGVLSGWRPIGTARRVTRAEGNVVYRIGDETALDFYCRYLGDKASQLPAVGVEYPFGLVDDSGRVDTRGLRGGEEYMLLRAPMAVDRATGAVRFAAEIPEGAEIKMTRATGPDVISGAREAARRALDSVGGTADLALFFSCMARKLVLGRRTVQEIQAAQEVFGPDVPMAGFYTYGEIANCGETQPICRFHNETATFLAVRE